MQRRSDTSTYTGRVRPGGPPQRRTVDHHGTAVTVTKLSVGPMDNNCYVLSDDATGSALIIDAANDAERVLALVRDVRVVAVLTTHGHQDHWQALATVARSTGAEVLHHEADSTRIPVSADRTVAHGETVAFGDAGVEVRHTPGHTDGSVCAVLHGVATDDPATTTHLFTGDTLFPGGPGKTQDQHQFARIMDALRTQLFVLPDQTWVYPGHGDDTTIGHERGHLDQWQARGW